MKPESVHLSSFTLDALILGALSSEERALAEAHLAGCGQCQADLKAIQASQEVFRRQVLPRTLPALRAREASTPWWRRPALPWVLAPSLAAILVAVVLAPRVLRKGEPTNEPVLSVKGGPILRVFARRQQQVFEVVGRTPLYPGDEIRFVVEPAGLSYVLIASVDGSGKASIYVPFQGSQSFHLTPDLQGELPGSIVLDATLGPERLFALFSKKPLTARDVIDALRKLGAQGEQAIRGQSTLPVAADAQVSILFEKLAPP